MKITHSTTSPATGSTRTQRVCTCPREGGILPAGYPCVLEDRDGGFRYERCWDCGGVVSTSVVVLCGLGSHRAAADGRRCTVCGTDLCETCGARAVSDSWTCCGWERPRN